MSGFIKTYGKLFCGKEFVTKMSVQGLAATL